MLLNIELYKIGELSIDPLITFLASVDQKRSFCFLEHATPPSGDQYFKHPYLGNRWINFESFFSHTFAENNI